MSESTTTPAPAIEPDIDPSEQMPPAIDRIRENQSATILASYKPSKVRYTVWNGYPYRDRWLMIVPIDPRNNPPVPMEKSGIGLVTNNRGFYATLTIGQICLYQAHERTVTIIDSIELLKQNFDIICKVSV